MVRNLVPSRGLRLGSSNGGRSALGFLRLVVEGGDAPNRNSGTGVPGASLRPPTRRLLVGGRGVKEWTRLLPARSGSGHASPSWWGHNHWRRRRPVRRERRSRGRRLTREDLAGSSPGGHLRHDRLLGKLLRDFRGERGEEKAKGDVHSGLLDRRISEGDNAKSHCTEKRSDTHGPHGRVVTGPFFQKRPSRSRAFETSTMRSP